MDAWIRWIDVVYIKGADWWHNTPKKGVNWDWEIVYNTKEQLKSVFTLNDSRVMPSYQLSKCIAN